MTKRIREMNVGEEFMFLGSKYIISDFRPFQQPQFPTVRCYNRKECEPCELDRNTEVQVIVGE